jgi:thiosulfate dehydrogenase
MSRFIAGVACGAVVALAGVAALVWFWPWRVEATGAPNAVEVTLMRSLLDRAVAREARLTDPTPPSRENLLAGLKIFRDGCAGCHGDGRHRSSWGSTSFLPRVPQFGSEPPVRSESEIYWIVKNGIRNTGMGGWAHLMSDEDVRKVAGFLAHVRSLPASVASEWSGPAAANAACVPKLVLWGAVASRSQGPRFESRVSIYLKNSTNDFTTNSGCSSCMKWPLFSTLTSRKSLALGVTAAFSQP